MTAVKLKERPFANGDLSHDAIRAHRQVNNIRRHAPFYFQPPQQRRHRRQETTVTNCDHETQHNSKAGTRPVAATRRSKTQLEKPTEFADCGHLEQRI